MKNVLMGLVVLAVGSLAFGLTGDGTESSPYLIYTQADLEAINTYLPAADAHFKLMQDIALTGTYSQAVIAPDGDTELEFVGDSFQGTFDGDGKKIAGLKIVGSGHYVGLFGYLSGAAIINLELEDIDVEGNYRVGGLAGYAGHESVIVNCKITKSVGGVSVVTGGQEERTGGLIGDTWNTEIRNCQSAADVNGVGRVGGLIGHCSTDCLVDNCKATGTIYSSHHSAGGLIGRAFGVKAITNSYATGDVTAVGPRAGGLIGWNSRTIIVSDCYATGNVQAGEQAGGLIGNNRDGVTVADCYATGRVTGTIQDGMGFAGGLLGINYNSTVKNCYATGYVEGYGRCGGLVGSSNGGVIINCRAEGNVTVFGLTADVDYGGGLVGRNYEAAIHNSYATGTVTGVACTGGLVGDTVGGEITRSFATGNVTGTVGTVGGLVGEAVNSVISNSYAAGNVEAYFDVGGLVGNVNNSYIIHCYAAGIPTSPWGTPEGLVGFFSIGSPAELVIDCFWDKDVSGVASGIAGTPLSTAAIKDPATFIDAGWGFFDEEEASAKEYWIVPSAGEYMQLYVHSPQYDPFEGDGTADNPYRIYTQLDLERVNYDLAAHYILMAEEIDLDGTEYDAPVIVSSFTPMGGGLAGVKFVGEFDGNHNVIRNLTINGNNYAGLFGALGYGGVIKNLGVEEVDITGGTYVGGLSAFNYMGTVSNCYTTGAVSGITRVGGLVGMVDGLSAEALISGSHSTAGVTGSGERVGGLVGNTDNGITIVDSYTSGDVNNSGIYTGGLVGRLVRGSVIDTCYATGNVSGLRRVGSLVGDSYYSVILNSHTTGNVSGDENIGGIVGYTNFESDDATDGYPADKVLNCFSTGAISANDISAGGIVGFNRGIIESSYSTGDVSGARLVGGIGGRHEGIIKNCYATGAISGSDEIGGIAGRSSVGSKTVDSCYFAGTAVGPTRVGAIVGRPYANSVIVRSFWDMDVSGLGSTQGVGAAPAAQIEVTGLTTAEMMVQAVYAAEGWDFATIWMMRDGCSYPRLAWQTFEMPNVDINLDGYIDIADLRTLAAYWLQSGACADISGNGTVDLTDLAILSSVWLEQ